LKSDLRLTNAQYGLLVSFSSGRCDRSCSWFGTERPLAWLYCGEPGRGARRRAGSTENRL